MTNVHFITRALSASDRTLGDQALDAQRKTSQLLTWMGVEAGMTVMDIMVGTGYTIDVLARVVGTNGTAYAVQPRALADIDVVNKLWRTRLERYPEKNLVALDGGDLTRLDQVPDASVDIVLSYLGYHDTSWMGTDRKRMNRELLRVLKPSGFYIIADHCAAAGRGDADAATLHRIEKSLVQAELAEAGFLLYDESDLLAAEGDTFDWNASPTGGRSGRSDRFLMRFIKADSPLRDYVPRTPVSTSRAAGSEDADEVFDEEALVDYAERCGVTIGEQTLAHLSQARPGYTMARARRFVRFQSRVQRELLQHPLLLQNDYLAWFRRGEMSVTQLRAFVVQLSVFTNSSMLAMLKRMIESGTLAQMRATKEILLNELGVCYRPASAKQRASAETPEIMEVLGTVDGGTFHHGTAHLEWIVDMGKALGLEYEDLGRPHHGTTGTRQLSNQLFRLYGSGDEQVAMASSYVIQQTSFARTWTLVFEGLVRYNARRDTPPVPLDFFQWHRQAEALRENRVQDTLEEFYFGVEVDEDHFIAAGKEMLDALALFWEELDRTRHEGD